MTTQAHKLVGQTLGKGRYEVQDLLGEGGMGRVYRARDSRLETDVVIKVPRLAMLEDPEFAGRFALEIRSLVKLSHPHVVHVIDVDEHQALPFAVMQHLSGGSLEDRRLAAGNRVPAQQLHLWLAQIGSALDFVHGQSYIHRDVKPENILFDGHDNVYLSDFGVAKVVADSDRATQQTGTGYVLGTADYMAPELIMGKPIDGRVDQYALAATVYQMVCGRCPFVADAPSALWIMHVQEAPSAPHVIAPDAVTAELSAVIVKGLSKDAGQRYPDCSSFAKAALAAVPEAPVASPPPRPPKVSAAGSPRVTCPSCQNTLQLKDQLRGKLVRCPSCKSRLRVAEDLSAVTAAPPGETVRAAKQSTVPKLPAGGRPAGRWTTRHALWGGGGLGIFMLVVLISLIFIKSGNDESGIVLGPNGRERRREPVRTNVVAARFNPLDREETERWLANLREDFDSLPGPNSPEALEFFDRIGFQNYDGTQLRWHFPARRLFTDAAHRQVAAGSFDRIVYYVSVPRTGSVTFDTDPAITQAKQLSIVRDPNEVIDPRQLFFTSTTPGNPLSSLEGAQYCAIGIVGADISKEYYDSLSDGDLVNVTGLLYFNFDDVPSGFPTIHLRKARVIATDDERVEPALEESLRLDPKNRIASEAWMRGVVRELHRCATSLEGLAAAKAQLDLASVEGTEVEWEFPAYIHSQASSISFTPVAGSQPTFRIPYRFIHRQSEEQPVVGYYRSVQDEVVHMPSTVAIPANAEFTATRGNGISHSYFDELHREWERVNSRTGSVVLNLPSAERPEPSNLTVRLRGTLSMRWPERWGHLFDSAVFVYLTNLELLEPTASRRPSASAIPTGGIIALDAGGHNALVPSAVFTPDGKQLITVSLDKTIRFWDVDTGAALRVLRTPMQLGSEGKLTCVAIADDGKMLAVGAMGAASKPGLHEGRIYLIALPEGRIEQVLEGHELPIRSLEFTPEGARLASAGIDQTARIWNTKTGECEHVLRGHSGLVIDLAFDPAGGQVVTASHDGTACIWSVSTGARQQRIESRGQQQFSCVAWSPDGETIGLGTLSQSIQLYRRDGTLIGELTDLGNDVFSLAFTPDSRRVLYALGGGNDRHGAFLTEFDDKTEPDHKIVSQFTQHDDSVEHCGLSPDGSLAVSSGGNNHELYIWRTSDGSLRHKLSSKGDVLYSVGWLDNTTIGWGTRYQAATNLNAGQLERSFRIRDLQLKNIPAGSTARVALHCVGTMSEVCVTAAKDNTLQITEDAGLSVNPLQSDRRTLLQLAPDETPHCLTFVGMEFNAMAPVAVGGNFGLYLFDNRTGKLFWEYQAISGPPFAPIWAVAPSPNGEHLLSGGYDQILRIWNTKLRRPVVSLFVAGSEWVAWTPDGDFAASDDGESLIGWHVNRGPGQMAEFIRLAESESSTALRRPDVIKAILGSNR